MKNLILSADKADQLGCLLAETIGIQHMFMDFVMTC